MLMRALGIAAAALLSSISVQAAYTANGPNVMYYWGQNSAGGGSTQGTLASYCNSGQADIVLVSFLHVFNVGGLPGINLSNACETTFPGTTLLTCPAIGNDIKTCQEKGIKVVLSLGGAAGSYGFTSDAQGQTFAQTIWDMFGGGNHQYRPFGDSVIDGVDLDIEGGPSTGYVAFVNAVRSKFPAGFLVGSAPQCPFPDLILGSVIDAVGFDFVNVQFYNNYCSAAGGSFNFDTWANWATTKSPNKNVKIYFTVPGAPSAAGSGYVPITTIQNIVPQLASQYPGTFGGVSVWDASQAWANGNFASQLYSLVKGSGGGTTSTKVTTTVSSSSSVPSTSTKTTSSASPTSTSTPGSCPAAGQACSTEGKYECTTGGAYAVCLYGKWSITSCPSGTSCMSTTDGASVYCGYTSGSSTCSSVSAQEISLQSLNKSGAVPKPYKASQVATQLTVSNATAKAFEAVINARRVTTKPFNKLVTIEFTAPGNVKFNQVDSGNIRQVGNKVRIQAQNAYNTSMSLVVNVKGSINSGVFVAPNPASLRFK